MFLTSRLGDKIIGGFIIRDRRRKPDEPFNPFAANANQIRQKKRNERSQTNAPNPTGTTRTEPRQTVDASDLRKKQEEARRKLGAQASPAATSIQKPAIEASDLNAVADNEPIHVVSRAERLAELRKQSQASIKKTELIREPEPIAVTPEPVSKAQTVLEDPLEIEADELEITLEIEDLSEDAISSKNVFKQIITNTPKKTPHRRRRRSRHDDSGGGRQPKVKKLNRQRYNDYKYAARDILDDESVADEHRSNLLGQIWAKGERIGVEATLEFILEKQEQLIINEEVAQRLRDLVRALTTRR